MSTVCFFLRICEQRRHTHSFLLVGKINTEQVITSVMNIIRKSRGPLAPVWGEVGDQRKLPTTETQVTVRAWLQTSPWSCRLACTAPLWNSSLGTSRSSHSKYDFVSLCPLCPLVLVVSVAPYHLCDLVTHLGVVLLFFPYFTHQIPPSSFHPVCPIYVESVSFSVPTAVLLVEGLNLSGGDSCRYLPTWSP